MSTLHTLDRSLRFLLRQVTTPRQRQDLKALAHRWRWEMRPDHLKYPDKLHIFLTTTCNLRCVICRDHQYHDQINFENIYKLAQPIRHARVIGLTGWGEVFVYPRLDDVLDYIFSLNHRPHLLNISTNGTLLSADKARKLAGRLDSLVISLNAASAEVYNRDMRGGDFTRTTDHVAQFMDALDLDDRQRVTLSFVAHRDNISDIPEFVRLAARLHVPRVHVQHYIINRVDHIPLSLLNVKEAYNRQVDLAREAGRELNVEVSARKFFEETGKNPDIACRFPFEEIYIEVDGKASPCCFSGAYSMGNVYEEGFDAVWFGPKYQKLRKIRYLPACKTCNVYVPFDNVDTHFSAFLRPTPEYQKVLAHFAAPGSGGCASCAGGGCSLAGPDAAKGQ